MVRRRRDRNHSPKNVIQYRIRWKMKKIDTQFLTPTKQ
jgi:SET domain-containing protein